MKRIFLTILFLLITCNGWAATYYVKTGGNDSAAGTSDETAWAHCPGMAAWTGSATLSSGDIVYFREGDTWQGADANEPVLLTTAGVSYYGLGYGTAGTRAILQATRTATTQSYGGVIDILASNVRVDSIEADANSKYMGGIYVGYNGGTASGNIDNVTVNNCVVHNVGNADFTNSLNVYEYGIIVGATDYTHGYKVSNVNVTNNNVHDVCHEGITIYPSRHYGCWVDTVLVRGNTVSNTAAWGATSWGHGYDVANHASNVTFEFNYAYDTVTGIAVTTYGDKHDPPEDIHPETYTMGIGFPTNIVIRYNIVDTPSNYLGVSIGTSFGAENTWTGFGDTAVYGNIVKNGGIYEGGNLANAATKIYNNTIYQTIGSGAKGLYLYENSANVSGIEWKNNIIYSTTGSSYLLYDYGGLLSSSQHSKNLVYAPSGNVGWVWVDGSRVTRTMANISTWESDIVAANPTFTGGDLPTGFSGTYASNMVPNTTYFAITEGDALGNGAVLASTYNKAINYAGTSSTYNRGAAWDIGAYEYTYDGGVIVNTGAVFSGCNF